MRLAIWLAGAAVMVGGCAPSGGGSADAPEASGKDDAFAKMIEQDQSARSGAAPPVDDATAAALVPPPPPAAQAAGVAPASIAIQEVDFAGLDKEIAGLQGKIVVADCWATWCGVCKEKFPKFVETAQKYAGRDEVAFVSVAVDKPEALDEARAFLAQTGAKTRNYLLAEDPNDFAEKFQANGVPLYLIYDVNGRIVFRSNQIDELAPKLEEMTTPKS